LKTKKEKGGKMKIYEQMFEVEDEIAKFTRTSVTPFLVIIAGPSCSGKTFLAKRLQAELEESVCLPLDWYFRDFNDPQLPIDDAGRSLFDTPGSYHQEEYQKDVKDLSAGELIWAPKYDIANNRRVVGERKLISPKREIIAEGLFAIMFLNQHFTNKICVYLDTPSELCLERRVARDVAQFGVTPQSVVRVYQKMVEPYNRLHVFPQLSQADIVLRQRR
jgi:uridine kinase